MCPILPPKLSKKYNSIKLPKKQETEKRKSKYAGKEDSQRTHRHDMMEVAQMTYNVVDYVSPNYLQS